MRYEGERDTKPLPGNDTVEGKQKMGANTAV